MPPNDEASDGGRCMSATVSDPAIDAGVPQPARHVQRTGPPAEFALRAARQGSSHTISLSGDLDLATAPAVENELLAAEATDADRIMLDLSDLSFIDSTGLRMIIQANARSKSNGARLRLLHGPPQVQRIFEITATIDTLPFADSPGAPA